MVQLVIRSSRQVTPPHFDKQVSADGQTVVVKYKIGPMRVPNPDNAYYYRRERLTRHEKTHAPHPSQKWYNLLTVWRMFDLQSI